ncbi:hypothetical protein TWF718_002464 [Orbilia javanica]|uniref:Uncharacterized protein n=1 Tax=Orbilia javanica TaxID=47235 RepID=A0AAN8MU91_9PEZI
MSRPWLLTLLHLGALLLPAALAQDAVFADATFPAVSSPNHGKVLRLCYPVEAQTNEIFMADTTDDTSCDDYGGGDRWEFVLEPTPASERISRQGTQAFEFPTVFDYFSLEAPDGRAIHFDSTPDALSGAENLALGDMGEPKRYSKAIFTTGHRKRLPRYGNQRGRVFPGDVLQFIGSSGRAVGYYRLFTSQRHLNPEGSFGLLATINAPNEDVILLTAAGDEEVIEKNPVSWPDRQSQDSNFRAIGAGNTIPGTEGAYISEESSFVPGTSRITETRGGRGRSRSPVIQEPEPESNNIITTEFVEEYPTFQESSSSNLFAESPRQAIEDKVVAAVQEDQEPALNGEEQASSVNSVNSLLEGAEPISNEDLIASAQKNKDIGDIGDRPETVPIPDDAYSEHGDIAAAIEEVQRSQDASVGYNKDISEAELSGFFPGITSGTGLSESIGPVAKEPLEEQKPADESFEDLRANTADDVSAEDLTPSGDAGVIGLSRVQQSLVSPQRLEVLAEEPNEAEEPMPELAQWNDDVYAIEDEESVLSQPPGLGDPPRRGSFDEIAQQIGASTVSDGVELNEGAAEIIGVEESMIDAPLRQLPLSSGMEEPLALLRELGLSNPDINTDAQFFFESPRRGMFQDTAMGDEGIVPSDLKPRRWGQRITGPGTESVPVIVPQIKKTQEPTEAPGPEPPSIDSTSRSKLSLNSNTFSLTQPAPPVGRRPLKLGNNPYQPAEIVADEQAQPRLLDQPEVTAIDTAEEMPAQVLAPLLEADEPINVAEPVDVESEEEKVQTVNEISSSRDVVDDEGEWSVVGRRVRPKKRKQGGQTTNTNQASTSQPDFWETMAQGSTRSSRNRGNGAGWSQNFGPNGQGGRRNYERR